ncbi:hypothetical protein DFJ73DRAFT_794758 [Zopfochytrium polystomum]|nr:hypothetical protein DFJ73DRAFT_794758 [Zopfochytrium polystomum]
MYACSLIDQLDYSHHGPSPPPRLPLISPNKRIAKMLVIESLAADGNNVETAKEDVILRYGNYMKIVNEIQVGWRRIFRYLADAGILSASASVASAPLAGVGGDMRPLPYRGSAEGGEKDFENIVEALSLIKEALRASAGSAQWSNDASFPL